MDVRILHLLPGNARHEDGMPRSASFFENQTEEAEEGEKTENLEAARG